MLAVVSFILDPSKEEKAKIEKMKN